MKRQQQSVLLAGVLALSQLAACSSIGWKGFGNSPMPTQAPASPAAAVSAPATPATPAVMASAPADTSATPSAPADTSVTPRAADSDDEPAGQN